MHTQWLAMALLSGITLFFSGRVDATIRTHETRMVQVKNGPSVRVEAGILQVPESRQHPTARKITIPWQRIKSTSKNPAAPIFLLAGGPGASELDELQNNEYFRAVAFYQTIADVVIFDQRGAGHSLPQMTCPQDAHYPEDAALDWGRLRHMMRDLLARCRDHWQRRGIDLAAYNTVESAADVNALRDALGYRSMTLIGGSYGSHLALQMMRLYPNRIDRVVLYGVEGPDQTWDSPDGVLAALRRIALVTQLELPTPKGGLLGAWSRVIERLEADPQTVTVKQDENAIRVVVDANLVRLMIRHKAGSHDHPKAWPEMILAMDRGDYSQAARAALDYRTLRVADPMHWSMDCASSVSDARRRRYEQSEAAKLLGQINWEYSMLCDLWPAQDVGKTYRANVDSSIPTLLFQGTWDTSTPLGNAREVAATLRNGQLVEVVGGNHGTLYNLYDHWPPIHNLLRTFLSGHAVKAPGRVVMPWADLPTARTN